ncbi:MAG: methyltransferase domain-containing protein [Verrucomicrobiales bacterium]|nr:methyltransferase domain-containing protein [Verrucomicrobiales bacterium]
MSTPFRRVLLLAALSGYVALSWEIVWARLYNYVTGSKAVAFGAMLGSYLLGLAIGSLLSMRWQKKESQASLRSLVLLMLSAGLLAFLVVPLASWLVVPLPAEKWVWLGESLGSVNLPGWAFSLPLVAVAAALQGTVLPLLCHVAIAPDHRAGARLSYVYLANIIGSGAGSLLTGFVLMDCFKLQTIAGILTVAAVLLVVLVAGKQAFRQAVSAVVATVLLAAAAATGWVHQGLWERLYWKDQYGGQAPFAFVQETRHGVVTVDQNRHVYGNGAYDGVINTTLEPGDYHVRPYFISAVHPAPLKRVLVIGVSAGAWTQIIASHPDQPQVDCVEISHGYLEVIRAYPQVSSILDHPDRIRIHIDDGRRWLKRNPDARFDCILMNTTHHWREFASALLSKEFLTLAKRHLNPDGVVMWNCTDSGRAAKTGMEVFPHTMMCLNNCIGANVPLVPDKEHWRKVLTAYRIDGRPLYDLTTEKDRSDLEKVLSICDREADPMPEDAAFRWWIVNRQRMERLWGGERPITDDNLGHEY